MDASAADFAESTKFRSGASCNQYIAEVDVAAESDPRQKQSHFGVGMLRGRSIFFVKRAFTGAETVSCCEIIQRGFFSQENAFFRSPATKNRVWSGESIFDGDRPQSPQSTSFTYTTIDNGDCTGDSDFT